MHQLAEAFPALQPALAQHLEDNFGDLLPHVFLAGVTFAAADAYADPSAVAPVPAGALLDFLEERFGRDDEVDGLVAVSVLENLPYPGEPGEAIVALLGPKLAAALAELRA